jgi:hypothetical protein
LIQTQNAESVDVRHPFRGFLLTYVLTIGGLAAAAVLWGKVGFDLLVVAMGWPHVVLGLALNLKRISGSGLRFRVLFGMLLLVTLAIGFAHSLTPITTLIYLYFVFHAFRDEIFIYHARRTGYRFRSGVLDGGGRALFIAAAVMAIFSHFLPRNSVLQLEWYSAQCVLGAFLSGLAILGWPRRLFADRPGLRYAVPAFFLMMVAMTSMKFMRVQGWNAPLFFTFLVVFHYFSWYVFSLQKMAARNMESRSRGGGFRSFFSWISTRRGFLTAVLALNVLSFLGAWSYQVLGRFGSLGYAFDLKYFLYFLVLHVTTSFVPRDSTRKSELAADYTDFTDSIRVIRVIRG